MSGNDSRWRNSNSQTRTQQQSSHHPNSSRDRGSRPNSATNTGGTNTPQPAAQQRRNAQQQQQDSVGGGQAGSRASPPVSAQQQQQQQVWGGPGADRARRESSSKQGKAAGPGTRTPQQQTAGDATGKTAVPPGEDVHVPVGGFNAQQVQEYMKKVYDEAVTGDAKREAQYRPAASVTGGAGARPGGPWGMKPSTMANGQDFWVQLKKQVATREQAGG